MLSTGEKTMTLLVTAPAAILISLFGCATAIPEVKQPRTHPSCPHNVPPRLVRLANRVAARRAQLGAAPGPTLSDWSAQHWTAENDVRSFPLLPARFFLRRRLTATRCSVCG